MPADVDALLLPVDAPLADLPRARRRRAGGVGAAARAVVAHAAARGRRASVLRAGRRVPRRRDGGGRDALRPTRMLRATARPTAAR